MAFTSAQKTALGALAVIAAFTCTPTFAQKYPITDAQRSTAQQVAEKGIPVSELAPNAPDTYVVKRGDTLWDISRMYLKSPWRWPELWGMNLKALPNPHLIFPGQTLYLDKSDGYARLRTQPTGGSDTVRLSPRTRTDSLASLALPTLKTHLIAPFLVEPLVADAATIEQAPRLVATTDQRVLMAAGDRVYARGNPDAPLSTKPGQPRSFRVFREAIPLKDPVTGEVLGYEARYLGNAELARSETTEEISDGKGNLKQEPVPATVDITSTKEEIRAGDRMLPEPPRTFKNYIPHEPQTSVNARVVSIYGSTPVAVAGQNQVIAINMGTAQGMEPGHVLTLLTQGDRVRDTTAEGKPTIKLPSEHNGLAMVFLTFERVSYALLLDVRTGVRVGDRLANPQ
ncbi:MAG: LysM peptidoglycan-binding domain-containing protein [Acidovorax sp.]|nr:LysM peptidoglycan-binding domain-containing protein [Acidovorax temperans]MBO0942087.1 LysM peptidoglycan-binding domain-containing protein [Acidovorax temperans]MBP8146740.1 LysM peptidoglycan-binding domain-containing protein [Acidovorax sp.]